MNPIDPGVDRAFHAHSRKEWTIERIGWALFAIVLVAALTGLLGGGGPLSSARAASPGGLVADYHPIVRYQQEEKVTLWLPQAPGATEARFWVSDEFLRAVRIEEFLPVPAVERIGAARTEYRIPLGPGSEGTITITFMPERRGTLRMRTGTGAEELSLEMYVFP